MNVYKDLTTLPKFNKAVVTIGTFDGVHLGHQQIIKQIKQEAKAIDGETVIVTFHPHPRNIVGDTSGVKLLTTLNEKMVLLEQQGINNVVIVNFNDAFAKLTAEEYVKYFLYEKLNPHTLIIGYDHKFGKDRSGDYHMLEIFGKALNFCVKEIHQHIINTVTVSSTEIRKALLHSNLTIANKLLGYHYFFEGIVIKGDQLGRTIGYPTANLQLTDEDKLVPGDGVYAVKVYRLQPKEQSDNEVQNKSKFIPHTAHSTTLNGMMYIGSRPVVNGKRRVIEINIFDFDEDIYGEVLHVSVLQYTRGDMPFTSLEALKEQLAIDKETVVNFFK
ncbi:MAG: riboflavin biosynthesis protein RibF [Bacteroidetes bacterium]|nr:riboflavin biosynthesis protein RibF [Bacteroidota bacterium]MBS1650222.1 riboflavin biosynthesis protein RibF [Bacteroidota bacterium]